MLWFRLHGTATYSGPFSHENGSVICKHSACQRSTARRIFRRCAARGMCCWCSVAPSGLAHIPFVTHGLRRGLHILGAAPRLKSSKGLRQSCQSHCDAPSSAAELFVLLAFDFGDLLHAPLVAATSEGRVQEFIDDLARGFFIQDARADGEHVGVVVLARHL